MGTKARVGVYLGHSTQHSKSIALVLSLETGLVSPQFHCSFDDLFETTEPKQRHLLPRSCWQEKAHFESPSSSKKEETNAANIDRSLAEHGQREALRMTQLEQQLEAHEEEPPLQAEDNQPHLDGTPPDPEPV